MSEVDKAQVQKSDLGDRRPQLERNIDKFWDIAAADVPKDCRY